MTSAPVGPDPDVTRARAQGAERGVSLRVAVAEDEEPLRAALADLIAGEDGLELVGTAHDADSAIELARALQPDVVLLDVRMPGGGGARATEGIRAVSPRTRTVALSAYEDGSNVLAMLRGGAVGYLTKGVSPTEILEAIHRAGRDQASLSAEAVSLVVGALPRDRAGRAGGDELLGGGEARFRRLLESTPDGVVMVEADGRILLANPQALRMFGYTAQELLGQPIEVLLPIRLRARHRGNRSDHFAGFRTRPMGSGLELAGLRKDGSEFPVDVSLSPMESDDGHVATAFIRDMSERRASEAMLRKNEKHFEALLESAPDAVVIVGAAGRISFVNAQAERLFGYHRSELVDRPIELLVPERFHEHHRALVERYLASPRPRSIGAGLELVGRRRNGTEFPVDISLSGIETSDGRLAAAFVRDASARNTHDVHERDVAAKRAILSHLVSAGEEDRRRIADDIHDDSIQVMTAAGLRLQILRRSLAGPAQLALLDELEQTIQLSISRLRHLLFELRPPVLDHEGLGPALSMYLDVAGDETSTSYHLEDRLTSQPSQAVRLILYRIAQEVLGNVRKHAGADNATVTLATREEGCYVRVVDDGIGFVSEVTAPGPGQLGLAAMRERAELAGGWLRVASEPGSGTTVEFWIAASDGRGPAGNGSSRLAPAGS